MISLLMRLEFTGFLPKWQMEEGKDLAWVLRRIQKALEKPKLSWAQYYF